MQEHKRRGEREVLTTLVSFAMVPRSSSGHADSADDPVDGHPLEAGGPGPEVSNMHSVLVRFCGTEE